MYCWKLWHDNRYHFIAWTILTVTFTLTLASMLLLRPDPLAAGRMHLAHVSDPTMQRDLWRQLLSIVGVLPVFAGLTALGLGSRGLGDELGAGTAEFLFTRPQRRKRFVWMSWAIGALQLLAVITLAVVATAALAFCCTGRIADYSVFQIIPFLMPGMLLLYGITFSASIVANSGRNGIAIALAMFLLYAVIVTVLEAKFQVTPPSWWFDRVIGWIREPHKLLPSLAAGGWVMISLGLPLLSQRVVEGREL